MVFITNRRGYYLQNKNLLERFNYDPEAGIEFF